jgi:WD40 repeat protein
VQARGLAWRALWLAPCALIAQGCGFPSAEPCALACGEQDACPGGFECQTASHRCVPLGTTTVCSTTEITSNLPGSRSSSDDAGSALAGAAGASADPGATGSAGAAQEDEEDEEDENPHAAPPTAPGIGSDAGGAREDDGPQLPPVVNELTIVETADALGCTGSELSLPLRASGGVGPYAWHLVHAPPGVRLSAGAAEGDAADVELQGVPSEAGAVVVELEDTVGNVVRSAEHAVWESPRIETDHLPSICTDEPYRAALLASGGRAGAYLWSAELVPAPGLPSSLAELGLSLQGDLLTAESIARLTAFAPFQIALRVQDGRCSSPELLLALDVVPSGSEAQGSETQVSEECPRIGIVNPPPSGALPAACRGNFYAESLSVEGGSPPYLWNVLSTPPGLHFDADSATLSGIAEGDGTLVVELTDANSRVVQQSYELPARAACWLAYLASETAPARLELIDPRLLERQPDSARRQLPADPASDAVLDFQFSPDGRFIAYRLGSAGAARLELADLADGQARALDVEGTGSGGTGSGGTGSGGTGSGGTGSGGTVAAYAWSPDAATLAVAFTRAGQPFLGGFDVRAGDLPPLEARAVSSLPPELSWYAGDRLAFLAPDPELPELRWLVTTRRTALGFEAPTPHLELPFSAGAQLLPGADGVFIAEPQTGLEHFFASDARPPVAHGPGALVSPSGAFSGSARERSLELFRGLDPSDAAPFSSAPGCTAVLAWASGRERIACIADRAGDSASQLTLFDVQPAPPALVALEPVLATGLPDAAAFSGHRRVFSPSGRWLALASADQLWILRSDGERAKLWAALPSSAFASAPGALAFAPDERRLLIGAANALYLLDLEQGPESLRELSASALGDDSCSERFVDGRQQWCGSQPELNVTWSRGSDVLAFRSTLGTLQLLDLSQLQPAELPRPLSPDSCSEACLSSSTARFQP